MLLLAFLLLTIIAIGSAAANALMPNCSAAQAATNMVWVFMPVSLRK
jgi:hypothetical protein